MKRLRELEPIVWIVVLSAAMYAFDFCDGWRR